MKIKEYQIIIIIIVIISFLFYFALLRKNTDAKQILVSNDTANLTSIGEVNNTQQKEVWSNELDNKTQDTGLDKADEILQKEVLNDELENKTQETLKVLVLEFDPILKTKGNIKCSEFINVKGNNTSIIEEVLSDMEYSSNGYLNIETTWIDTNEFPRYTKEIDIITGKDAEGNDITSKSYSLNEETWLTIMQNGWYEGMIHPKKGEAGYKDWYKYVDQITGFCFDYDYIIDKYKLIEKRNNGEFDFVFLSLIEPGNAYEAMMVGRNAYWINGSENTKYDCKFFPIIYANIVRKDTVFHSVGHMSECILSNVFDGNSVLNYNQNIIEVKNDEDYNKLSLWQKFTLCEYTLTSNSEKKYGLGNVHFPPNTVTSYDYTNNTKVLSNWKDWRDNYPNLKGVYEMTDSSAWLNEQATIGAQYPDRLHMRWWFKSMPHLVGRNEEGFLHNWWKYISTMDYVQDIVPSNDSLTIKLGKNSNLLEYTCYYKSGDSKLFRTNKEAKVQDDSILEISPKGELIGKRIGSTYVKIWKDGKNCTITINVTE